ncbi:MAG: BON domain-containing protein [Burkholderia sp.]|nr:BON domain-containing protein [Burkholderia sp.]
MSLIASTAISLQGCAAALAGAAISSALIMADRRTLGTQTEDREIQIKAMSHIHRKLSNQAHVNIAVFNHRVLMTGEVPNKTLKYHASEIVRSIYNVNGIINELSTEPISSLSSRVNDIYLESRVKAALINNKRISANYYKIVGERKNIYLLGLVTSEEANCAADITSHVPGVKRVVKVFQYLI